MNKFNLTDEENAARPYLEEISTYICDVLEMTEQEDQLLVINCIYNMVVFVKKNPIIDQHFFHFDSIIDKLDESYALEKERKSKKNTVHN